MNIRYTMISNPVITALKERRSVKSYFPKQISNEELETILDAAQYAPTGMNKQSPVMVVVQDKETIDQLDRMNAEIMNLTDMPDYRPFYGAPTLVIVFGNPIIHTWLEDATLVAGNLLNAAHSIGVGGCWIHRARQMFETEEGKALMNKWGVPEGLIGVANCILGYQDASAKPRVARKENYVIWAK